MNLTERIDRRRSAHQRASLVVDREPLSPVVHRPEPVGRGPSLERLLDVFDPVFDGELPNPVAVVGPAGSGTSAIVTALFDALTDRVGEPSRAIRTATRARTSTPVTWFVSIDTRRVASPFAFYRTLLSVVSTDPVPTSGIGTDDLCEQLADQVDPDDRRLVVAIDHHDEPETLAYDHVRELVAPMADSVVLVPVGQAEPPAWDDPVVAIEPYRDHELVDVITDRVSTGLAAGALDHESVRDLATWADGNAHHALAALFSAALVAENAGSNRISSEHVEVGKADIPDSCVHVDRALALSSTRQQVLLDLVSIDAIGRPIREVAADIADRSALTVGTVTRFLYEIADRGILERVPLQTDGSGRGPSTLEPRFPTIPFRALSPVCTGDSY